MDREIKDFHGHIPVRVPCGHALCQDCIIRWLLTDRNEHEVDTEDFRELRVEIETEHDEADDEVEMGRIYNEESNIEQTENAGETFEGLLNSGLIERVEEPVDERVDAILNLLHEDQVLDRIGEDNNPATPEITPMSIELSENHEFHSQ